MFCIVADIFGNIRNCFSAYNWVFMAALWVAWLVWDWFVDDLGGLWVIWVVLDGLAALWLVCGWFGWFVGNLAG